MHFLRKIINCLIKWHIAPDSEKKLMEAEVIVAQSFGLRKNGEHCQSNVEMGRIINQLCQKFDIKAIPQIEIAECTECKNIISIVQKHQIPGEYLDTYEVIRQAMEICKEKDFKKIIVVSHPDHVWRCKKIVEKFGFKAIIPDTSKVGYDPKSDQIWTTHKFLFIIREIPSRLLYLHKRWM